MWPAHPCYSLTEASPGVWGMWGTDKSLISQCPGRPGLLTRVGGMPRKRYTARPRSGRVKYLRSSCAHLKHHLEHHLKLRHIIRSHLKHRLPLILSRKMLKIALAPPPLQNSLAPVLPQAPSLAAPVLPQALSLAAPVLPQALAPANDRLFPNDRLLAKSDYRP